MITSERIISVLKTFGFLFGELLLFFIAISFVVALLQVYISKDRIKRVLTTPKPILNSVLGALFGAVTPFCSCSTIPILAGLLKSGAPFSGAMSFLLTSPILNPAIIALFLTFFGIKATILYTLLTFSFAVGMGLLLDKLGFEKQVKTTLIPSTDCGCNSCCESDSTIELQDGECCSEVAIELNYESLQGTFLQKNITAWKYSVNEARLLFKGVIVYLLIGAGIGAFIYEFIPTEFLTSFAGADNAWAVPAAAVFGIPMYIRTETMIPIAGILIGKGVGYGTVVALIIGGAGASIPEVSLLSSLFKKKMVITFVICVILVATVTGYIFNLIM